MFKNIANFNNTSDYLPLFNGVLITDLFVILLSNMKIIQSSVLIKWYADYNLSAVIADVLIIFIGLIIVRAIYYYVFRRKIGVRLQHKYSLLVIKLPLFNIFHKVLSLRSCLSPFLFPLNFGLM